MLFRFLRSPCVIDSLLKRQAAAVLLLLLLLLLLLAPERLRFGTRRPVELALLEWARLLFCCSVSRALAPPPTLVSPTLVSPTPRPTRGWAVVVKL